MSRLDILKEFVQKSSKPIPTWEVRCYSDERRKVFSELIENGCIEQRSEETRINETVSGKKEAKKVIRDYYYIDKEKISSYVDRCCETQK